MVNAVYTAEATSSGDGRNGKVRSSDGLIDQDVKMPPALGGPGGGTNPEELFAAAYATCFHSALRLVARTKKVAVPAETTVTAAIGIGPDGSSFAVNAVLTAHLPGLDQSTAQELVEGAHQVCPYSKATRGNIDVDLKVTV
ncbi:organic hydroperoxide resistance protein [Pseudonocardia sp. TRM90224]|uniref:organic hydroperoxide resistance protein n=1 Tax=Pseudonocardia sp. TRM90224 TaxID=2812678 RepID=UPI001E30C999|nr:organic hydroperoxide resistance protein [Pseudonocardia sp. TRM90224]